MLDATTADSARFRPRSHAGSATSPRSLDERFESEALPHMSALYATACRLAGNRADAEDLVQEAYLRAFRGFARYTPDTNIRGWLFTILYRTRTDQARKASRSPRTVELFDEGPAAEAPRDRLADGHEEIARALSVIPEAFRAAVLLRDVEDLSYQEIAAALAVPIGTVMSRIHRGRALLRGSLAACRPS